MSPTDMRESIWPATASLMTKPAAWHPARRFCAVTITRLRISPPAQTKEEAFKIELIMKQAQISTGDRRVIAPALGAQKATGAPAAAIELADGTIITGKTSRLLGACSALLLNALKHLAGIEHNQHVISPEAVPRFHDLRPSIWGASIRGFIWMKF